MLRGQRQCLGTTAVLRVLKLHEKRPHDGEDVYEPRPAEEEKGTFTNGFDLIVVSNNLQVMDVQHFESQGLSLRDGLGYAILVVKSMQHFRAAFHFDDGAAAQGGVTTQPPRTVAAEVLVADGGGLCSPGALTRPQAAASYVKVRRPIYPWDSDVDYCTGPMKNASY